MAYDEDLAHRVRAELGDEEGVSERQMFGGLAFLLDGNMAVALAGSGGLMVRVGREAVYAALERRNAGPIDMGGRRMTGWVLVAPDGVRTKRQVASWVRPGVTMARSLPPKGGAR